MASANLELVRSIFAAWEAGDYSPSEWAHPEIEFVIADGPAPGSWTGKAGITAGWGDFLRAWEGFRQAADEYRELDDERVLALLHWGGRGKASGVELAQIPTKAASLFELNAGKVTRIVLYFDSERALAELGLASEAGSPRC